jgi:uncharacterized protein HemY
VVRTLLEGVVAVILGFVVVVAAALVFQSLRSPGLPILPGLPHEPAPSPVATPPVADLPLPPLPAPAGAVKGPRPVEEGRGFVLPDRGASYLEILLDTLEAERATDPARVRRALEALQRLDAPDPRIYRWLGTLYHQEQAYQEAAAAFERAVALEPTNASDRFNLATVYLVQERFPQAIRELTQAIRLQPPFLADAYAYLGYCLYAMGDEQQARKAWEVSLQLDPNNAVARRYSAMR